MVLFKLSVSGWKLEAHHKLRNFRNLIVIFQLSTLSIHGRLCVVRHHPCSSSPFLPPQQSAATTNNMDIEDAKKEEELLATGLEVPPLFLLCFLLLMSL